MIGKEIKRISVICSENPCDSPDKSVVKKKKKKKKHDGENAHQDSAADNGAQEVDDSL